MSAWCPLGIASVLMVLFAAGRRFGLRKVNTASNAEMMVSSMQSLSFGTQGVSQDLLGFLHGLWPVGDRVSAAGVRSRLANWENPAVTNTRGDAPVSLGRVPAFVVSTYISWTYFVAPLALSSIITAVLIAAAVVLRALEGLAQPVPLCFVARIALDAFTVRGAFVNLATGLEHASCGSASSAVDLFAAIAVGLRIGP